MDDGESFDIIEKLLNLRLLERTFILRQWEVIIDERFRK